MGIHTNVCGTLELRKGDESGSSTKKSNSHGVIMGQEFMLDKLPEDIFDHLYTLVPMEDAARAACVSHRFLRAWRCYPKLVFNRQTLCLEKVKKLLYEETLAFKDALMESETGNSYTWKRDRTFENPFVIQHIDSEIESHYISNIEHVFKNRSHSASNIKVFELQLFPCPNIDASYLDKWLQIAVKPGIEDLIFEMAIREKRVQYNFPCFLLSDEIGGMTLQSLHLTSCAFHPLASLGYNRTLTSLYLNFLHITGEELGQFVSNCLALMRLSVSSCNDIICFKATCILQNLSELQVTQCEMLQVIEISAPKLTSFIYGENVIPISLGADVKHISLIGYRNPNMIYHARTQFPSFMSSVERLIVESLCEMVKTPIMQSRFLNLKYLDISCFSSAFDGYDYLNLVSFLVASPALETLILRITCLEVRRDPILRDSRTGQLRLRVMPEHRHDNLKNLLITGFISVKSLIEFTRHIVQNAPGVSCVTLDTSYDCARNAKTARCEYMCKEAIIEAKKAFQAVRRFIERIVPSSVVLRVLMPCSQCGC